MNYFVSLYLHFYFQMYFIVY